MFNDTKFYVFDIDCSEEGSTERYAKRMYKFLDYNDGDMIERYNYGLCQLECDTKNKSLTFAAFGWDDKTFKEKELFEALKEKEIDASKHKKISARKLEEQYPKQAEMLRSLFRTHEFNEHTWKVVLSTDSEEEVANKIKNCHCQVFVDTIKSIETSLKQRKTESMNCGIVFVCEKERSAEKYIKLFRNYCLARGIVKDPLYIKGDLEDAVNTERNSSCFYFVEKILEISRGECSFNSIHPEEMSKLIGRKPIYITCMNEKTFEILNEKEESFRSVFPFAVHISGQTMEEKFATLEEEARSYGFELSREFLEDKVLDEELHKLVDKIAGVVVKKLAKTPCDYIITPKDFGVEKKNNKKIKKAVSAVQELEQLIGLENVKTTVKEISAVVQKMETVSECGYHMVFRGNPGTGKTTVARIIARILGEIGVLSNPERFVEGDRGTLIGEYVGETAVKTKHQIKKAMGGVLFIDEAYALYAGKDSERDYGREAIATLIKAMEDHRRNFVCILAGYTNEMDEMLSSNPGIRSRVSFYIDFPDYSAREMLQILEGTCKKEKYTLDDEAKERAIEFFEAEVTGKDKNFANGRTVRSLFEMARMKQALRSSSKNDRQFTGEDFEKAAVALGFSKEIKRQKIGFGFVA